MQKARGTCKRKVIDEYLQKENEEEIPWGTLLGIPMGSFCGNSTEVDFL